MEYTLTINILGYGNISPLDGNVHVSGAHIRTGCRPEGGNTNDKIFGAFVAAGGNANRSYVSESNCFLRVKIDLPSNIADGNYNIGGTRTNGLHCTTASERDGMGASVFVSCDPLLSDTIDNYEDFLVSAAKTLYLLVPTGHGRDAVPVRAKSVDFCQ